MSAPPAHSDEIASALMQDHPGRIIAPDSTGQLAALAGHLHDAYWLHDTNPNRLHFRINLAERHLRSRTP